MTPISNRQFITDDKCILPWIIFDPLLEWGRSHERHPSIPHFLFNINSSATHVVTKLYSWIGGAYALHRL